jgi:hypothetical protein
MLPAAGAESVAVLSVAGAAVSVVVLSVASVAACGAVARARA